MSDKRTGRTSKQARSKRTSAPDGALRDEVKRLRDEKERSDKLLHDQQSLHERTLVRTGTELAERIAELQRANEEIANGRRAALNVLEDAIISREALRQSEEQLQRVLESSEDGIEVIDKDWRYVYRNPAGRRMQIQQGLEPDYGIGRKVWDAYPPFVGTAVDAAMRQAMEQRKAASAEYVFPPTGRQFAARFFPMTNGGISVYYQDVTERKRAEQAVRDSESRLSAIANVVPDLLCESDPDGRTTWYNQQWLAYTGQTLEQAINWGWVDAIHPDDRQQAVEMFHQGVHNAANIRQEYRIRRHDGKYRWFLVQARPVRDEQGAIIRWLGAATDIHEQRTALDAIREREEQLRLIFEGAGDFAIFMTDPNSIITAWNVGAEHVLGFTEAEALGKSAFMIFTPEDQAKGAPEHEVGSAIKSGRAVDERWHIRKSGQRFWGSGVLQAIRNPDNSIRGFVKIMRDNTSRKQAEETLQAAKESAEQANRMKDEFLATLSHELRTPLSVILLWSKILTISPDSNQLAEGLRAIRNSAEAQKELIEDLLDMSRITMGALRLKIRDVDLAALLNEILDTIAPAAAAKEIVLENQIHADIGRGRLDPDRIRQVLWNLLMNAVKFTPEGGRISLLAARRDHHVEISVSDTGQGISADFLPHVFDRFRQADASSNRRQGGLGLGLSIAKQLVELHGGSISAQSAGINQGSTFTVELPLTRSSRRPLEKPDEKSATGPATLRGRRVLLVEDDADSRSAVSVLLSGAGAEIMAVDTAADALRSFKKSSFDLIVSDIGLPTEDGYSLIRRIRQEESLAHMRATPALALTAFARETDRRVALEAGFQQHLGKPVDPEQLLEVVGALLPGQTGSPG